MSNKQAVNTAPFSPSFSQKSPYLWSSLLTFVLTAAAMIGIELPASPEQISGEIISVIQGGGYYALIAVIAVNIIAPVVSFIRKGGKVNLLDLLGSPSFWIAFGSVVVGLLIYLGIDVPKDTPQSIIGAIFARDWAMLAFVAVANLLNPIVRYLRDRKKQLEATK